MILAVT
jgi:hypothetical protein